MALAGLGWLAGGDAASLPTGAQADCLRSLEQVLSVHTAARAKILRAFSAQRGYEDDGQGSPRTWLTWQARITRSAACIAVGWMRRLCEHPAIGDALATGQISASWARQVADWTDAFPAEARQDADVILLAAAAGGADLVGMAELAEQIRRRVVGPDRDRNDGFADRGLRLATTLGGAGTLRGDLSTRCAAALQAVLDSLAKKHGPEDVRTVPERHHDALEEACMRLLASGCLPDRAGQPVQLQLNLTLDELLNGAGSVPTLPPSHGSPSGMVPPAGPGDDCDAAIAPMVTGRVDHDLLDELADKLSRLPSQLGTGRWAEFQPGRPPCDRTCGASRDSTRAAELSRAAFRQVILHNAIALLSGTDGLASWLRTGRLPKPAASVSLPLDVGAVTDLVPPHLRRAIIQRDRHCAAPGCDQSPAACHVHHIVPRSQGGRTCLTNCLLLCPFHHLILVHRWGWTIVLNSDGTTAMTSPDGRVFHSHDPPAAV
jgi:hypothetical protein